MESSGGLLGPTGAMSSKSSARDKSGGTMNVPSYFFSIGTSSPSSCLLFVGNNISLL